MANSVIGQAVKEKRRQANMTVRELAELVPADDRTIFRYEAEGRIRPDVLARLAQIFKSKDLTECYCRECPVKKVKFKGRQLPWYRRQIEKGVASLKRPARKFAK
jgi:predicted transcriptional regulator